VEKILPAAYLHINKSSYYCATTGIRNFRPPRQQETTSKKSYALTDGAKEAYYVLWNCVIFFLVVRNILWFVDMYPDGLG